MFIFFVNRDVVESPIQNWLDAQLFTISFEGVVSSFPLIIFAYMYQVNIPMIYNELEKKSHKRMGKVIKGASAITVLLYLLVGIFGYITFINYPGYTV